MYKINTKKKSTLVLLHLRLFSRKVALEIRKRSVIKYQLYDFSKSTNLHLKIEDKTLIKTFNFLLTDCSKKDCESIKKNLLKRFCNVRQ